MPASKLRPLGVMILALLREADMHPYEMMRLLRARHDDRHVRLHNGTFYHQIGTLVRDGFIGEAATERDGARPERTIYHLLPAGDEAITTWVRLRLASLDSPRDFSIALAEAHNLERAEVVELLGQRIDALTRLHESNSALIDGAHARHVDPQYLLDAERELALIRTDIAWLSATRESINDPNYAWGYPSAKHISGRKHFEESQEQ